MPMSEGAAVVWTVLLGVLVVYVLHVSVALLFIAGGRYASRFQAWRLGSGVKEDSVVLGGRAIGSGRSSSSGATPLSARKCTSRCLERGSAGQVGVTVVVPAFLPNEHEILEHTIAHILSPNDLRWPGDMQLIVTYNTPRPMDFEQRLRELEQRQRLSDSQRRLNVMCVDGSKSKAANVNAAVAAAEHELLVVYDADNIPEPDSLLHLHERMVSRDADVVQGMTYKIPSNPSCGRYVVQLMDTATMFLSTQLLAPVWLYFTPVKLTSQANCLMKIDVPRKVPFEPNLLVEDIDWCLRVHAQKWKSEYCCLSQVGEQAAPSFHSMHRQARRYGVGMEQIYRALCRRRYAPHSFRLWVFFWPGIWFWLIVNFLIWPGLVFYNLFRPVGDAMPSSIGEVADSLLAASMYANLTIPLFPIGLLELFAVRPYYWRRRDYAAMAMFHVLAFPLIIAWLGAKQLIYGVYGFYLVQTKRVPGFESSGRSSLVKVGFREGSDKFDDGISIVTDASVMCEHMRSPTDVALSETTESEGSEGSSENGDVETLGHRRTVSAPPGLPEKTGHRRVVSAPPQGLRANPFLSSPAVATAEMATQDAAGELAEEHDPRLRV